MKIVLCGYMGSGKSKVGSLLANKLKLDFLDLDEVIEKNEKISISKIFLKKGEIFFRKKENEALNELLLQPKSFILSLGGGTPCYANNLELLKNNKDVKLVYLKVNVDKLTERLWEEKKSRPLISTQKSKEDLNEFIRKHLFERQFYYLQSDYVIDVSELSLEQIATKVLENLK